VFPANSHVIRPATQDDAIALRPPVLVAEVRGVVAAAISRDDHRTISNPALAPAYLTTILRLRADALAAVEREPRLSERIREAVLGPRESERLPLAA
jgi:hypothetical protein